MDNRVLGVIAMLCAPAMLGFLLGGEENALITGIASMVFMAGWICSNIGRDSDLVPAVETALRLFDKEEKQVGFLFPSGKPNKELKALVPWHVNVKARRYAAHQFPDPYQLKNGKKITKPPCW